jgi:hypothetical protein
MRSYDPPLSGPRPHTRPAGHGGVGQMRVRFWRPMAERGSGGTCPGVVVRDPVRSGTSSASDLRGLGCLDQSGHAWEAFLPRTRARLRPASLLSIKRFNRAPLKLRPRRPSASWSSTPPVPDKVGSPPRLISLSPAHAPPPQTSQRCRAELPSPTARPTWRRPRRRSARPPSSPAPLPRSAVSSMVSTRSVD